MTAVNAAVNERRQRLKACILDRITRMAEARWMRHGLEHCQISASIHVVSTPVFAVVCLEILPCLDERFHAATLTCP